jgi:parallel beta-helix repeat protein
VYCDASSPTLTNCTISGNEGGGVYSSGGSPTLTNCTISGNEGGPGVYCAENCTTDPESGEVHCLGSSPKISSCIIWGNSGGAIWRSDDASAPVVSYSCVEGDPVWPGEGNINSDPLFLLPGQWEECGAAGQPGCVKYQWNPDTGEPTAWHRWIFDYHLQPGSPCIDAGTSDGAQTTDIEGHSRPCGAGVDIGAYEFGDCPASGTRFVRGDVDGKGGIDISDPIFLLTYLFIGGKAPDCLDAGDINDDGSLDISDAVYSLTFQFLGGDPPKSPYPGCGIKEWINGLGCQNFAGCQ